MEEKIKCDRQLLVFLQQVEKKHVDYLVDVLTDEGHGRLALSSSIKDLLLTEKVGNNYSAIGLQHLLHELQEFGGHSLMNFFRKEPLTYEELLTDVHKKLNGTDSKTKSAWKKEREIVLSLFGAEWKNLTDRDRWDRCTNTKVLAGFFNMKDNLNFDEKGWASGFSAAASAALFVVTKANPYAGAAAAVLNVNSSIGEAYRITIPFVAQIAMIKMLYTPQLTA